MKKLRFRRITSVLLSIFIGLTVFPSGTFIVSAESYTATFYVDKGSVVIDDSNAVGYGENGKKITVANSSNSKFLITQYQDSTFSMITSNNISISGTQDVTLKGVNIYPGYTENADCYALLINKNSNVNLTIDTYAKLSGGSVMQYTAGFFVINHGYAGLQVHESSSVEIYGFHGANNKDYLYATGGSGSAAGIGGGYKSGNYSGSSEYDYKPNAGDITIYSGNIRAEVHSFTEANGCGAGIGCGVGQSSSNSSNYKSIKILGGIVEAYGGRNSAGIGGAQYSNDNGQIVIKNAKVSAFGGDTIVIGGSGYGGVTIESGTVTVASRDENGQYTQSATIGMSSQKTYISGGTLLNINNFYGGMPTVSATDTRNVCPVTINLPAYNSKKTVENLNVTTNGLAYSYGGDSIYPSADKKLVLYLPEGETSVKFEYNDTSYNFVGNVIGIKNTLKIMQEPLNITGLSKEYTYGDVVPTPTITGGTTNGLTTIFKGQNGTVYNDSTPPTGAGEYTYTAVMAGNDTYHEETATYDFKINPKNITFDIDSISDRTFTGSAIEPAVIVKDGAATLIKDKDYTLSYTDNIIVGTAAISISGAGNYQGSTGSVSFNIVPKSFNFAVEEIPDQPYTGSAIEPDVTVKDGEVILTKDTDYTVLYTDNIKVSNSATISVTGIGNYNGSTASASFKIVPSSVPYTVTYQAGTHGSISSNSENVVHGESPLKIPNVTPNNGYSFAGWSSDGGTIIITNAMLAQTIITDYITYSAIYITNGTVSPTTASFDLNNPADVNTAIAWNNATSVTEVQSDGKAIDAAYYEVTGNTIVFKKEYLQKQTIGSLVLTVVFNKGNSAVLTINIANSFKPEPISPPYDNSTPSNPAYDSTTPTPSTPESTKSEITPPTDTVPAKTETNNIPSKIVDKATGITLDLSGAIMPKGVTSVSLGSSSLPQSGSNSQSYTAVFKLISDNASLGELDNLVVYDLELLDQNGYPIKEFKGKIKVKIKIPSNMSGNLHVFWYNPDDNLTDMNAIQEDEHLVFETTHFGFYAVAQLGASKTIDTTASSAANEVTIPNPKTIDTTASSAVNGVTIPNPKTGGRNFPIIPLLLIDLASVGMLIVMKKRIRFKKVK